VPASTFVFEPPTGALPLPAGVYRIGGGVSQPVPVFRPNPDYFGVRGTVIMAVIVGSDGTIREARVVKSLDPRSDQAALESVKRWRFRPAMKDGHPVAIFAQIEVNFGGR